MNEFFQDILNNLSFFDFFYIVITILFVIQCSIKGFVLSLLAASKWLLALIITIIIVPRIKPWTSNYVSSDYLLDIGLGISIFVITIFIILMINKAIGKAVKYSGLGSLDVFFGFVFGFFKAYIVCVALFSLVNWFYPYEKWTLNPEKSFSFSYVYKGSNYLIKEFPSKKIYEKNKKKIENI